MRRVGPAGRGAGAGVQACTCALFYAGRRALSMTHSSGKNMSSRKATTREIMSSMMRELMLGQPLRAAFTASAFWASRSAALSVVKLPR